MNIISNLKIEVADVIRQILGNQISYTTIYQENLVDIGLDSLFVVRLIAALEEKFNIVYSDEELIYERFSSFRSLLTELTEKLREH
ncbi:acyl carrier protein [Paenibacillus kobensis]|uniref:acyl carrier protein n=1 Tax=Paenibacillus kobensis TaxID=59841 RepID=UPI001C3FEB5C|nr:acyl carrier protein [Paenibacillus kobensis]